MACEGFWTGASVKLGRTKQVLGYAVPAQERGVGNWDMLLFCVWTDESDQGLIYTAYRVAILCWVSYL